jgi:hypothetical protein
MPKAVLKNGVIYPLEPLPPDWTDGKELRVEGSDQENGKAIDDRTHVLDEWSQRLEALCAESDPQDEAIVRAAIDKQRQEGKRRMRLEMGLGE